MDESPNTIAIYVDADACPVKPEIYRVAERHRLKVFVVANSFLNVPREPWIERHEGDRVVAPGIGEPERRQMALVDLRRRHPGIQVTLVGE